jgi:hypothetical protein
MGGAPQGYQGKQQKDGKHRNEIKARLEEVAECMQCNEFFRLRITPESCEDY